MGLGAYGWRRFGNAEYWDLLDDVNLAIHETGHVVFSPLGDHPGGRSVLTLPGRVFGDQSNPRKRIATPGEHGPGYVFLGNLRIRYTG